MDTCTTGSLADTSLKIKAGAKNLRSLMNIFVYGSLLVPKIWNAVTRFPDLVSHPATLSGFAIFRVRNADFPCIVESPEATEKVKGKIFLDVPDLAVKRLDAYEDNFYDRRALIVTAAGLGELSADAYCLSYEKAAAILSPDPWTLAWFEETALTRFWERHFVK